MSDPTDLKIKACAAIDSLSDELFDISNIIWNNPELYFEEYKAHEALTNFLEKQGFQVERQYKGISTAFKASIGQGGPHVAALCEYDALENLGHACGHNLIAEVGVATGIGIKAAIEGTSSNIGTVSVIGTPAEEDGGGKIELINLGAFQDVDFSVMAHPFAITAVDSRLLLASQDVTVTYKGRPSHAAGFPWEGVNALDAAVMAYNGISCLRQQLKPTWRMFGIITEGGTRPNVIPERTSLLYSLRVPSMGDMAILKQRAYNCFQAAAVATGCQMELEWEDKEKLFQNVINNKLLADLYRKNAERLGVEFCSDENKLQIPLGSTDMGNVTHVVPGIHPMFNIGTDAANHTREFASASGSKTAQKFTLDQAKALAMASIEIFCDTSLLETMKRQFQEDLIADGSA